MVSKQFIEADRKAKLTIACVRLAKALDNEVIVNRYVNKIDVEAKWRALAKKHAIR